jgi:hypothetical protein
MSELEMNMQQYWIMTRTVVHPVAVGAAHSTNMVLISPIAGIVLSGG